MSESVALPSAVLRPEKPPHRLRHRQPSSKSAELIGVLIGQGPATPPGRAPRITG
ncbi:hypothetical protein [Streptomyces lacrimifluminis]|uniref:hypothetical protein n=1 Tax=Streptomyces lacrimifluminis TaxID=1500077 RepID=UPI001666E9FF|nr:hypothetical protein [Streptomyces lacrimifluminis]